MEIRHPDVSQCGDAKRRGGRGFREVELTCSLIVGKVVRDSKPEQYFKFDFVVFDFKLTIFLYKSLVQ